MPKVMIQEYRELVKLIINGYNIIEKLYKDIKKSVYRAEKDGKVVIMKVLDGTDISEEKIKEMQYEFEVLNMIAGKGAVMPIEIIKNNLNYAIVFEFFSGIKFDEIDFKKWSLEKKLKLMYNMFDVIEKIHNKEIVHKNINPATILYDENSDEIKMLEFGNAAILSKEKIIIPKGNIKEREINYISPEQTGRTNRSIDYRTDYYSIGAVFYEILSGEKLFKDATTPIEIIYRHIAKEPTPIKEINSAIPETVSDIVDRLLSKNSESRYQTSAGIKDDLKKCIDMLKTDGNIIKFKLVND